MHASEAFVNGAAHKGRKKGRGKLGANEDLNMINTLLAAAAVDPGQAGADERKAHEERSKEPASKPGGFQNDPNDPSNPNEVRERHLKTVKETKKVKVGTV
jgi:hypothetical protein